MKQFARFLLLFISSFVLIISKRFASACGFYVAPGEYRFWLLQSDLTNQRDLTPFFFASTYLYRGNMNAAEETFAVRNIEEWFEALDGKVSRNQIDSLLNFTSPEKFFSEQSEVSTENSMMRLLFQKEYEEFYQYLILSKKVEGIADNPDPWGEKVFSSEARKKVISEGLKLHARSKSAFVRLRTAYQLIRLYHFEGRLDRIKSTYAKWLEPAKTKSWIKSAALYQMALTASGYESNYLLSKVFDRGDYRRTTSLVNFKSQWFDSTLKLAGNVHERNVLIAMKAFNCPGRSLELIKKIYATEPHYKELPFLLLREVNKVEDWLLTTKLSSFGYPAVYGEGFWTNYEYYDNAKLNYENDTRYAQHLYQFLKEYCVSSALNSKPLAHIAAAHLALVTGRPEISQWHLHKAESFRKLPRKLRTQIRINKFLLGLEKGFTRIEEHQLMSIINATEAELGIYDPGIMKNQLILYTGRKLINRGDKAKGLLLLSKTNRALGDLPISNYKEFYQEVEEHADEHTYDAMVAILKQRKKSVFGQFISAPTIRQPYDHYGYYHPDSTSPRISIQKLLDCKASWYIRSHRLQDAYAVLKILPDSFYERQPYTDYMIGDPFYLNVYRPHRISIEDKRSLNKKEVVEELIRLEAQAKKEVKNAALNYYKLGNAWYNMTYHGKYWLMVKQWWSINEPADYSAGPEQARFNADYYECKKAREYYEKALQYSRDKKLSALCFFMVRQCEMRRQEYKVSLAKNTNLDTPAFKPDYSSAKGKGIDINYYRRIVEECELYQSFTRQYNRPL
jgi:hypothetical protein